MATAAGYFGVWLLGVLFGLLGTVCFIAGFRSKTKIDSGQPAFGRAKPLDPVRNTDRDVVDAIRQERYEKGLDPYLNEDY